MNTFAFRARTQDEYTISQVMDQNGYGLPESFDGSEVIIDLGANIGCFVCACMERGAGYVECYELESENFILLRRNVRCYGRKVRCFQRAVWRSDEGTRVVYVNNHHDLTAMHHIFNGDGQEALTLGLDAILKPHKEVDLLKIDIEGSEFPVLYTSQLLGRVKRIVGEIHPAFKFEESGWDCTPNGMKKFLEERGFEVDLKPSDHPGLAVEFDAVQMAGVPA